MKTYEKYLNELKMTGGELVQFRSIFRNMNKAPKGTDIVFRDTDREFGFIKKNKKFFTFKKSGDGYVVKLTPMGKQLKDAVIKK